MSYMTLIKGKYTYSPVNKTKYYGDLPIQCRSKWEYDFCQWCDLNDNILAWSSEPLGIPYFDPTSKKNRRYFPDFLVKTKNGVTFLVEVKPKKETRIPKAHGRKKKTTLLKEQKTYLVNKAKWAAAMYLCKKRGWIFKIITEQELYGR